MSARTKSAPTGSVRPTTGHGTTPLRAHATLPDDTAMRKLIPKYRISHQDGRTVFSPVNRPTTFYDIDNIQITTFPSAIRPARAAAALPSLSTLDAGTPSTSLSSLTVPAPLQLAPAHAANASSMPSAGSTVVPSSTAKLVYNQPPPLYGKPFPPCPMPVYSSVPIDKRKIYGTPDNLTQCRAAWVALWDHEADKAFALCVQSELTSAKEDSLVSMASKKGQSVADARAGIRTRREIVHHFLLNILRPIWVIAGVTVAKIKEGEWGLNKGLMADLWGEKGADLWSFCNLLDSYVVVRKEKEKWLYNLARTKLKQDVISLLGITPPQTAKFHKLEPRDLDTMLAKPHAGPLLRQIIDDGVKLVSGSQWSPSDFDPESDQLSVKLRESCLLIEDAMVRDGLWSAKSLETYRDNSRNSSRWTLMNEYWRGQYPSLRSQLVKRVLEESAVVQADGEGIKRTYDAKHHHTLAVAWGRHDRHTRKPEPLVDGFLRFERASRKQLRDTAMASGKSILPLVKLPADGFCTHDWEAYNGEVAGPGHSNRHIAINSMFVLISDIKDTIITPIRQKIDNLADRLEAVSANLVEENHLRQDVPTRVTRHTQHGRHHTRRGARHSTYFSLSPPIKVLSEEEATVQVATEIEAVIQDEQEFRDKLNDESKTRHDAYLDAVKDIHAEPFDIQAAYEATIATFLADFQLGQPELAEDCEAAIQTLEDPYFKPQDGDRARFNFDQCSSLATRIMARVQIHFPDTIVRAKEARSKILLLLYDTLVLAMSIRTPGLAGFYIEAQIRSTTRWISENTDMLMPAKVMSRIHADLVGIEVSLILLYSQRYRHHDVAVVNAWSDILEGDKAPRIHPAYIHGLIKLQHRVCGTPHCEEVLLYKPNQLLIANGPQRNRREFVSVQQTVVRGNVDLGDNLPGHETFPCLWEAFTHQYSAENTTALARYCQIIHTTERKAAGKGHEGSLAMEAQAFREEAEQQGEDTAVLPDDVEEDDEGGSDSEEVEWLDADGLSTSAPSEVKVTQKTTSKRTTSTKARPAKRNRTASTVDADLADFDADEDDDFVMLPPQGYLPSLSVAGPSDPGPSSAGGPSRSRAVSSEAEVNPPSSSPPVAVPAKRKARKVIQDESDED